MPFDPILAERRFGYGLSPVVPPVSDVAQMLAGVSGPDAAAQRFPIPPYRHLQDQFVLRRRFRQYARKHPDTAEGKAAEDKLRAVALSMPQLLLHVSRPMRWDSDHVILQNDDILSMAHELVSADLLDRTFIGLDFFDATISRTAAWVIGVRNMQKALLRALLTPWEQLRAAETDLDFTARLTLTEEFKDLPFGVVWAEFCDRLETTTGLPLIRALDAYQAQVAARG